MESKILEIASTQGLWASLSVILIIYVLKTQEKRDFKQEEREKSYQKIIYKLTDKLNLVEDVKKNVEDIKNYILNK